MEIQPSTKEGAKVYGILSLEGPNLTLAVIGRHLRNDRTIWLKTQVLHILIVNVIRQSRESNIKYDITDLDLWCQGQIS